MFEAIRQGKRFEQLTLIELIMFENDMKPLAKLKKHKNVALLHASHFCLPLLH